MQVTCQAVLFGVAQALVFALGRGDQGLGTGVRQRDDWARVFLALNFLWFASLKMKNGKPLCHCCVSQSNSNRSATSSASVLHNIIDQGIEQTINDQGIEQTIKGSPGLECVFVCRERARMGDRTNDQ